uniref:Uncharacterized protein n=1 Tax=Heterorhabditis bacteriophora TaxID=37862 RepID=A0A1I7WPC4_HETBA
MHLDGKFGRLRAMKGRMTPSGQTALGCQKAPEAAQHLCAKRFRSVQNYSTSAPEGEMGKEL